VSEKSSLDQERLMIAHFTEPLGLDYEFEDWPLHISILPWFHRNKEIAVAELELAVVHMKSCRIALGAKALDSVEFFGVNEDIPVRRVKDCTSLGVMHGMLLSQFQLDLEDKTFIGGAYNPHLTIRENEDPGEGFEIDIKDISLVEYGKPVKKVVQTFNLRNL